MLSLTQLPLENGVCRIRPLQDEDAYAYAMGSKDSLVQSYAHLPESDYTVESVMALIGGAIHAGWVRGDLAVMAIAHLPSDDFYGSVVLFDVTDSSAEIGFWLTPGARGRGLASAALELAARFAACCGLEALRARTVIENMASQRVLERAGFEEIQRAGEVTPSGIYTELIHYEIELSNPALQ